MTLVEALRQVAIYAPEFQVIIHDAADRLQYLEAEKAKELQILFHTADGLEARLPASTLKLDTKTTPPAYLHRFIWSPLPRTGEQDLDPSNQRRYSYAGSEPGLLIYKEVL